MKLGTQEIGKIYLGSTEIVKAYLGSTLMFDNTNPIPQGPVRGLWHFDDDPTQYLVYELPLINSVVGSPYFAHQTGAIVTAHQFGTQSLRCNYTSQLITTDTTVSGDFTVDFWASLSGTSCFEDLQIFSWDSGNSKVYIHFPKIGGDATAYAMDSLGNVTQITTVGTIQAQKNTWSHYAIERKNGVVRFYYNGTQSLTTYTCNEVVKLNITGCSLTTPESGYTVSNRLQIDELRICHEAMYNGDDFTPPDNPYTV